MYIHDVNKLRQDLNKGIEFLSLALNVLPVISYRSVIPLTKEPRSAL